MNSLAEVAAEIKNRDKFLIIGHVDPDGDCIGSMFACYRILKSLGKQGLMLFPRGVTDDFNFLLEELESPEAYQSVEGFGPEDARSYRNWIALDAGSRQRLALEFEIPGTGYLFNIDHHPDNTGYGDLNYIDDNRAAVGEIIYELAQRLEIELDPDLGTAIATAIIADTGAFRYQNITPRIFRLIARLMDIGVDVYQINRFLFGNNPYEKIKLKGMALSTLELSQNGRVAWLKADRSMMNSLGIDHQFASGLVNYARDIQGVEVGISFTEVDTGETKVSFRSNEYVPVNQLAAR
ncbi:MAG: DHH family phosphoesterase, partial [Bacillota bacterium]